MVNTANAITFLANVTTASYVAVPIMASVIAVFVIVTTNGLVPTVLVRNPQQHVTHLVLSMDKFVLVMGNVNAVFVNVKSPRKAGIPANSARNVP